MMREEHVFLRKCEMKNGVVGEVIPIDQLIEDIVVDFEWQDGAYNFDVPAVFGGNAVDLGNGSVVVKRICFVLGHDFWSLVQQSKHDGCLETRPA
jgi:hypothetical protein